MTKEELKQLDEYIDAQYLGVTIVIAVFVWCLVTIVIMISLGYLKVSEPIQSAIVILDIVSLFGYIAYKIIKTSKFLSKFSPVIVKTLFESYVNGYRNYKFPKSLEEYSFLRKFYNELRRLDAREFPDDTKQKILNIVDQALKVPDSDINFFVEEVLNPFIQHLEDTRKEIDEKKRLKYREIGKCALKSQVLRGES